jgi:hypothetical protein
MGQNKYVDSPLTPKQLASLGYVDAPLESTSKTPIVPVTAEQFISANDKNIFNQDISTSIAEGVGGLYSGASNLLTGGYHAIVDPLKKGYEEGGTTGTLGALLKTPYDLVASATDARRALLEKAKTAESSSEKIGYNIAGRIPFLGPAIATAAQQIGSGRPETMGEGVFNTLMTLESSPSFRALTNAGKAKVIASVKSGAAKIPAPAIVKTTLRSMIEDPGLALTGAVAGYQEGGKLGAVAGALGVPSVVNKGFRMYREGLATRERMQERGITSKREDVASKLASDAELLADARAETAKNTSAKTQSDLFRLEQAHKNRLERDVLQAGTSAEGAALRRSQQVGDRLESREFDAKLAKEKAAANALELERQDALRTSREGKTEQTRKEGFARADEIRARQERLASEKATTTRGNVLSDAASRNARKAEITADHAAAQLSKTHLSNVESMLKAQTPDALNATKQIADYHLELAEGMEPDFRAALQSKIDQVFEAQSATMAERRASQNAQMQGLESKDIRATRSSSTVDANNRRQRITEAFGKPAPVEELVPQQDLPASSPTVELKGSTPTPKLSGKVTPNNVLEKLDKQAQRETTLATAATTEEQIQARVEAILAGDVLIENMAEKDPRIIFAWDKYHATKQGMKSAARNVAEPITNREAQVSMTGGKSLNTRGEVENLPFGQRRKNQ